MRICENLTYRGICDEIQSRTNSSIHMSQMLDKDNRGHGKTCPVIVLQKLPEIQAADHAETDTAA